MDLIVQKTESSPQEKQETVTEKTLRGRKRNRRRATRDRRRSINDGLVVRLSTREERRGRSDRRRRNEGGRNQKTHGGPSTRSGAIGNSFSTVA